VRTVTTSLQPNGSKPAAEATIISTKGKSHSDKQKSLSNARQKLLGRKVAEPTLGRKEE
jgi:hypothetical protein